ncbi:MAG TPA: ABC transporter permease [Acidimicrobiales bacterium]|nr:ABC transporter permease [Acidimicrobiales bacterium]
MKTLRDIGLLFQRQFSMQLRNPTWLFVGFSSPVLYLALFTPLLKHFEGPTSSTGRVLDSFFPGILALLAFASGTAQGFNTIFELRAGVIERLRVTPASRFAILAGPLVSALTFVYIFDAIAAAVAWAFGFQVHWLGLLVLAVLLGLFMVTMSAWSVATALVTKEISGFAAIMNGLNLPLLLLAGVLLPISYGPAWLRGLAHVDPLYYVVDAARALGAGTLSGENVWLGFAVIVPLCALVLAWTTNVFRKAVA